MNPDIKSEEDIAKMRESGHIAGHILARVASEAKPGVTTQELNDLAEKLAREAGVKPAFLGYDNFPAVLCTSVNETIVHGLPGDEKLHEGDIVGLDFGVIYEGWYSDTAVTVGVGEISFEAQRLLRVTKKALRLGIRKAKPGNTVGDIGNTIQRYAESEGYSVVRELVGHGIGKDLHEEPHVPNYGKRGEGEVLREGMTIAVEPMLIDGLADLKLAADRFGYQSPHSKLTAHFEHTIAIKAKGAEVLTEARR
ncbi:MAG: type I methionyl aminopeptidase [Candidatus Spechtbacterales bacterium]